MTTKKDNPQSPSEEEYKDPEVTEQDFDQLAIQNFGQLIVDEDYVPTLLNQLLENDWKKMEEEWQKIEDIGELPMIDTETLTSWQRVKQKADELKRAMGIEYAQTLCSRTLGVVDRTISLAENFLDNLEKVNAKLGQVNLDDATRLANATLQISADAAEGTVAVKNKFIATAKGMKDFSDSLKSFRDTISQKLGIKHSGPETEPEKTTQSQQRSKQTSTSAIMVLRRDSAAGGGGGPVDQRTKNPNPINQLDVDSPSINVQNLRKLWEERIKEQRDHKKSPKDDKGIKR